MFPGEAVVVVAHSSLHCPVGMMEVEEGTNEKGVLVFVVSLRVENTKSYVTLNTNNVIVLWRFCLYAHLG